MSHELANYAFNRYGSDAKLYNGIHDLETLNAELLEALKAAKVQWNRGPCPRKLEEALTWRENDEKATRMVDAAIARAEEQKGEDAGLSGPNPVVARPGSGE